MRAARLPRALAAVVGATLLAPATLACTGDDAAPGEGADGTAGPDAAAGPRVPDEIAAGCGEQAVTDPGDLGAGRVVARCGPDAPAPAPLPAPAALRVAVPPAPGPELAPVVVAEALGEFDAEGLDVTTVPLDDEEAMAALDAGEVDVVVGPIGGSYLDALDGGSGARLALGGVLSRAPNDLAEGQAGLWVRTGAVTDGDLGDLALQPVAAPGGVQAAAAYPLDLVMSQTSATLNEVALRDAAGPEAATALLDGELAAAWLDAGAWPRVAGEGGAHLAATLPASESIDGTVVSARLLGPDRAVGLAYVRAILRTINTHLTGDYTDDEQVMDAIAEGTRLDPATIEAAGPQLFDWEVRDGTVGRIQEALVLIGGVAYDAPLPADRFVDRTLAAEVVG